MKYEKTEELREVKREAVHAMTEETSLEQIVMPLLSWYDGHARVLPW